MTETTPGATRSPVLDPSVPRTAADSVITDGADGAGARAPGTLLAAVEHALDAIGFLDDEGRIVDANPALTTLTGCRPGRLHGRRLDDLDLVATDPLAAAWAELRARGHRRGRAVLRRADGQVRTVEYEAVADVAPGRHLFVARDVTDQDQREEQLRFQAQLLDAVGEAVIATDLEGRVRYWGPAAEALYGYTSDEALGRPVVELTVPAAGAEQAEEVLAAMRRGDTWTGEFTVRRRDGRAFTALVTDAPFHDASGRLAGIIGISKDVTAWKESERLLSRRAAQQAAVADLGQLALRTEDPRAVTAAAIATVRELLGPGAAVRVDWRPCEAAGAATDEGDWPPDGDDHETRLPVGDAGCLRVHLPAGPSPQDRQFLRSVSHLLQSAVRHDATRADLAHLATHDPVTGLPNRTLLLDRLEQARLQALRSGQGYALLFLDLDGFKLVNDALGHDTGDDVLRMVADRLRASVRPGDTVARFGGDEFAVLCPGIRDLEAAAPTAERLRAELARALPSRYGGVMLTASVGVVLGDDRSDTTTLLRDADVAMYAAKDGGRNRVAAFTTAMQEHARQRLHVAAQLRRALDEDRLVVHYQPSIDLATGRLRGVEALARIVLPDGSLLPPAEFIDVAEDTGLIAEVGERVLRTAAAAAARWLALAPDLMLAVNLSPRQLADTRTVDVVCEALRDAGLPAGHLWLEITESALLTGERAHAALQQLRLHGVQLAIDDFGTGYSSLAHLRRTPVDMLKVDRGFVAGLTTEPEDRALVRAAIELARAFGLQVTAEGVETAEQLEELVALECDYAQGFLLGRPMPQRELTARLADAAAGDEGAATTPYPAAAPGNSAPTNTTTAADQTPTSPAIVAGTSR